MNKSRPPKSVSSALAGNRGGSQFLNSEHPHLAAVASAKRSVSPFIGRADVWRDSRRHPCAFSAAIRAAISIKSRELRVERQHEHMRVPVRACGEKRFRMTRLSTPVRLGLLCTAWAALVLVGLFRLESYAGAPGPSGHPAQNL